jgi:CMP-N,N'-diacetyllegionaminic acid synthase
MRILGLIPARGGSKGVPAKNIRPLAGKSLIQRAYECGMAADVLERIVLSTDNPAIADHGCSIGVAVPFVRPADLATDVASMLDVVLHALDRLRELDGYEPDAVLLLQPTAPLRTPEHIRKAVERLGGNDSVCSVVPLPKDLCPHYVMRIRADEYLDYFLPDGASYTRRQDVPQAYKRDGTIFLTRSRVLMEQRSFYGARCVPLLIDAAESLNIDTPEDWAAAERALADRERINQN